MLENRILDYNNCDKIKMENKVRFAGVINSRGRLIAGRMKEGIVPLESKKDDEMILYGVSIKSENAKRV